MNKLKVARQKTTHNKNLAFIVRVLTLFIFIIAAIISIIFSSLYLQSNGNLSIEFSGGYKAEVQYTGKADENSTIKLLEQRVDPLGTSNINIFKSSASGNFYSISISKQAGITPDIFINNLSRRGYVYLLDQNGNDLLANTYSNKKFTPSTSRIVTSDAFSSIASSTNNNSHQPEVTFKIKDQALKKEISSVLSDNNKIYFYSDIGGLLNYMRNNFQGLEDLVNIINSAPVKAQTSLEELLANATPGFAGDGSNIVSAMKSEGKSNNLRNILDQQKNGSYTFDWTYNDTNTTNVLSVDTNNKDIKATNSAAMTPWLPYINKLILLPDISQFLNTELVNYKYADYYIGTISSPSSIANGVITINDDTFNEQKVEQISYLLNAGMTKNNFDVTNFSQVNPSLGTQALKMSVIALIVALVVLSIIMLFNYRFLGLIAIILIIFFFIFTLVSFTFLNNIASPETGIALIISFALLLDVIIGLFNRIEKEYKTGKTVFDAFKVANRKSLSSAFDASLIVLIVSLAIFWFGSRSIQGFAIMTAISTFGVIVIGVVVLRLILYFILKNNYFENKIWTLFVKHKSLNHYEGPVKENKINQKISAFKEQAGLKFKIIQSKLFNNKLFNKNKSNDGSSVASFSKWNFWHKSSKWIVVVFGAILIISGITYLAAGTNFGEGFNNKIDFIGETSYSGDPDIPNFNLQAEINEQKNEVINVLNQNKQQYNNVYGAYKINSLSNAYNIIQIIIETNIKESQEINYQSLLNTDTQLSWTYNKENALSGNQLFITMLIVIAISMIIIIVYVFIRFQLTFVIPLILGIIFSILFSLALISLLHITISTMTIGVILAVLILVLINSVVIFDRIKEIKLNNAEKLNQLKNNEIVAIANEGIKKSLSRTIALNSVIILTALIILCFVPSLWAVCLSIILGTIISFVTTHFIVPWLWTFFERLRIRSYKKRAKKIKKHFVGPDEYIIPGIND